MREKSDFKLGGRGDQRKNQDYNLSLSKRNAYISIFRLMNRQKLSNCFKNAPEKGSGSYFNSLRIERSTLLHSLATDSNYSICYISVLFIIIYVSFPETRSCVLLYMEVHLHKFFPMIIKIITRQQGCTRTES